MCVWGGVLGQGALLTKARIPTSSVGPALGSNMPPTVPAESPDFFQPNRAQATPGQA